MGDAAEVLLVHVSLDGWCQGCRELWSRLVPFPCTQVDWARHVHETTEDAGSRPAPGASRLIEVFQRDASGE
jgi:hypothetical protein